MAMPRRIPSRRRIHDKVLQLLGAAMLQSEMAEQLGRLRPPR